MPGGELLKQTECKRMFKVFSDSLSSRAGGDQRRKGFERDEIEIQKPLVPPDALSEMANLWWIATSKEYPGKACAREGRRYETPAQRNGSIFQFPSCRRSQGNDPI